MTKLSLRQRVESRAARAILGLPPSVVRRLGGATIVRDGRALDPQVQLALVMQRRLRGRAPQELGLAEARAELDVNAATLAPRPRAEVMVEDRTIAGPGGALALRVYRPQGAAAPGPALIYFHGGGFVVGGLDSHDPVCQALAAEGRCAVIAVDYRLAPEHRFPAAVEDALAAFDGVRAEAEALGVDPERLAVGGDSAGGNLAAVVALERRGAAGPRLQVLLYPAVDLTMSFPSIQGLGSGFFLEATTMAWYVATYLGEDGDRRDPRASPWFAPSLAGAAPAYVLTAGFDPLRDEGDAYATRLAAEGVAVTHRCFDGMFHGFLNAAGAIEGGARALSEIGAALRAGLR